MHQPAWLSRAVFYNIYPQSFYDTNADGIGDLNGITEKMEFIQDMGYTAIWLNPFYVSPFRDAGYDVTDFYQVAPRYGTNEDFETLCRKAHALGIKVIIDLVAGHTSLECAWFQESCKPEKNVYSNRYIWTDSWDKDCDQGIGGYGQRNGRFMKNFFYCQPALNYGFYNIDDPAWQLPMDHPDCLATRQELLNIMDHWINLGADGFRVDMASSLIKNDPEKIGIKEFWQDIRRIFDEKYPQCVLISEWSCPETAIPAGFHIDFILHFNLTCYTKLFRAEAGRNINPASMGHSYFGTDGQGELEPILQEYTQHYNATKGLGYMAIPTGNHDLPRISYRRGKKELETVYAFVLTMPGVPFVYYGDEIGMAYEPDLPSKEGGYNRTGSRTPMQWCCGKNAGFSQADPKDLYLPVQENGVNVEDQLQDDTSLLNMVKKLIRLRKNSDALSANGEISFCNHPGQDYPLVYRRTGSDGSYLVCINPTGTVQEFSYPLQGTQTLYENTNAVVTDDRIILQPVSFAILKLK